MFGPHSARRLRVVSATNRRRSHLSTRKQASWRSASHSAAARKPSSTRREDAVESIARAHRL